VVLGLVDLAAAGAADRPPKTAEPTYVVFHLHSEWIDENRLDNALLPGVLDEIRRELGASASGSSRYVGFSPGLLFVSNLTPQVLVARVKQALDLAEQTGLPVFFHLDDMHFWYRRSDLIRDPEAVEWSAFPRNGEVNGPLVPRYWLNWGTWMVFPAPPPCFECPKFRADIAERLAKYVAAPIVERLQRWRSEGKAHLLAGIAIGNETQVPDYRMDVPRGQEPEGIDVTRGPTAKARMGRQEMVRTGYAALHRRGHTAASIERLARQQGRTADAVTTDLLYEVAQDYAAFRAKTLLDAGIPRERLYTHFTSPFRAFLEQRGRGRPDSVGTAGSGALPPPVKYAVNPYSRPGFTVARDMVDLRELTREIEAARGPGERDRAWAAVETYPTTGQPGRPQSQPQYEEYLGGLFANGATVVNVYGWNLPAEAPFAIRRAPGALRAIQSWRSGHDLPVTWVRADEARASASVREATVRAKIERFHRAVERRRRDGTDLSEVDRIMQRADPLLREGRLEEAEPLLDRALAIVE